MKTNWKLTLFLIVIGSLFFCGREPQPVKIVEIGELSYDPAEWGKNFPHHFDLDQKTAEPTPVGKSFYKRGWDTDLKIYDKLSEYPFLALLYNGFGFGIEYNEPRGHFYMLTDVLEIDASRRKPGGVCLTCKSPYAQELQQKYGRDYFSRPFEEVLQFIPEKHRTLGISCISCHNPKDMRLQILNEFTLGRALEAMKVDRQKLSTQDMRSLVCAQCHVTYVVKKDSTQNSIDIFFPWQRSRYGRITIEEIIAVINSDPGYLEWKQAVTGFKLGFIRHPEFELFSNQSVHWSAGLSCADCHLPFVRTGQLKISDHRIMSPLKNGLRSCLQCHNQSAEWLRERIKFIQERTTSQYLRSGYSLAVSAKLFEQLHNLQAKGQSFDSKLYQQAIDFYQQSFYRLVFVGAENSIGFHNPQETMRILADCSRLAAKSEALLRQLLTAAGVSLLAEVDLELEKYLNERGQKKLNFIPEMEFKDPFVSKQE